MAPSSRTLSPSSWGNEDTAILHNPVYLKVQQATGLQEMSPEPQDARLNGRKRGTILTVSSGGASD